MNKTEKGATIEALKDKINESSFFYLADASSMTVAQINSFRRICHEKGIEVKVVKNTLARKAMEALPADKGYADLYEALHGPTAMLFADAGNAPAKVIKDFRATSERPILKAAYIDSGCTHRYQIKKRAYRRDYFFAAITSQECHRCFTIRRPQIGWTG